MNLTRTDYLKACVFAFIVMVITFQGVGLSLEDGSPPSWTFALNYFATHGVIFGHQVYYTYGPLGYLIQMLPIENNLSISLAINCIIRLLLIYNLFLIITKNTQAKNFFYKVLMCCFLVMFCVMGDNFHTGLFYLTISYICLYNLNQKKAFLIAASFFSLLMLLEKPGFSFFCFSAVYAYLLLLALLERKFKPIIIFTITSIVGYFIFWVLLNHSFVGSINYLLTIPTFTAGNSMAMSMNPSNHWGGLIASFICFLLACAAFIKRPIWSKDSLFAFVLFLLPAYAMFKYSFTREDGHQLNMIAFLILSSFFMAMIINNSRRLLLVLVSSISCVGLFYWALQSANLLAWGFSTQFYGYNDFKSQVIHFSNYQETLRQEYEAELAKGKLPPLMLAEIGNNSVDVYNFMQGFVPANHLNWEPRPIFQTYASFMPYFDNLNAHFFQSIRRPPYLIWAPFNELDGRYILSTEPMAMYQIFKWYKPIMSSSDIYLLKTQSKPQLSPEKFIATTKSRWNHWVLVPASSDSILRVRLNSNLSLLGKVKTTFYKLFNVTIDYLLADNTVVTYRLVYPTAIDGVWVSPLLQNPCQILNLGQLPKNSKVVAIRFSHDKFDYFRNKIKLDWYGADYLGNAERKSCKVS